VYKKTLGRFLRGEGTVGAVKGAIATCWPSLECHGDVGDGTVKDPRSCGGHVIPYCCHAGVVPLLTSGA
jgi:hypothetical protein